MLPSKQKDEKLLECNICNHKEPIVGDLINSYKINKEVYHPPGEEFKNIVNMENWEKKEIYNKFKK